MSMVVVRDAHTHDNGLVYECLVSDDKDWFVVSKIGLS